MIPRFRASDDVIAARLGEELVLLHVGTKRYYRLNVTATETWDLVAAGHDASSVARTLAERFATDMTEASGAVEALVDRFVATGLVEPTAAG